eukprot:gene14261-biopygen6476
MVVDSQNPFTVAMFRPDDEQLEGIVTHSFFGDDANAFEQFVVDMSRLRAKCLAFLNAEAIGEAITQKVFLMFAEALLAALRERSACSLRVEAVNRLELTATLAMRDEPNGPVHEPREQRGYADVAFLSSVDGARLANDIRVIGELKADLRNATAYAEKDQLLIEMEALRLFDAKMKLFDSLRKAKMKLFDSLSKAKMKLFDSLRKEQLPLFDSLSKAKMKLDSLRKEKMPLFDSLCKAKMKLDSLRKEKMPQLSLLNALEPAKCLPKPEE